MRTLKTILLLASFSLAGCDLASDIANDKSNNYSNNVYGTSQEGSVAGNAINTFLWKPISEGDGNLVVILPASLAGNVELLSISGSFGTEVGESEEVSNGAHPTFRFDSPGASYGANITVQAVLSSGGVQTWTVPSGGTRNEQ